MQIKKLAAAVLLASGVYAGPALAEQSMPMGMHGGGMGKQCPPSECGEQCKHHCTKDLEARLAALEAKAAKPSNSSWTWGADIEVEGSWGEDYAGEHTSDIVVATAYLSLEGKINKQVTGFVSFLYEEDDTPFDVDEAYLDFAATEEATFRLGQEYIPFGTFNSHLINDPLTLEIGEAVETVAQASFAQGGVLASAYVYAGDAPYDEEDRAEDGGVRLQYSFGDTSTGQLLVGVDYASNIADTDTLEGYFIDNAVVLQDNHEGYAAVISYDTETWGVIAEQLGVLDAFETNELAFASEEAKPVAARAEAWVSTAAMVPNSTVALAYNQTDEAVALELPESRVSLGFMQSMQKDTWSWGVEAFQDTDYADVDGGTDEKAWGVVAQVAASL